MYIWQLTRSMIAAVLPAFFAAIPTVPAMARQSEPVAVLRQVDGGKVRGGMQDGLLVFRGIPYAAPPVGELRWRPPKAAPAWQGIRDATAFGADCIQNDALRAASRAPGKSEDCLFLNIWAPSRKPARALPVMVWIYGGGYAGGSGSLSLTDGAALAKRGVIVVSFNYRTGILGFMAHPALSAENPHRVSGNYGLLDARAALQWVQRNIGAFGGDPSRVTVFGVSSGASLATMLLVSPQSKNLFHAAILESPGALRPLPKLSSGEAFGASFGDIADLRAMDAHALQKLAEDRLPPVRALDKPRLYGPIVDGWLLPTDDAVAFANGAVLPVPVIIGDNADEGGSFVDNWPITTVEAYRRYVEGMYGEAAPGILARFCAATDADVKGALSKLFAYSQFLHGVDVVSAKMAGVQPRVWRYRFAVPTLPTRSPAKHGHEVPYVFGTLPPEATADDRALSAMVGDAWVDFATNFDPNGNNRPIWPRFRTGGSVMVWDAPQTRGRLASVNEINVGACSALSK